MPSKERKGFLQLALKSLAVISTSLLALLPSQAKAEPKKTVPIEPDLSHEKVLAKRKLHKFVLKLNPRTHQHRLVARHASHSSHSSHASHSSYTPSPGHSSHSSHLSSSPTYSTGSSTPSSTSSGTTTNSGSSQTSSGTSTSSTTNSSSSTLPYFQLGSRDLYKNCKGTDVQEVQKMLVELGYDTALTGFYGDKTEAAVRKFQVDNKLPATGKVDSKTLSVLQSK
jgi:hypothetical protein